MRETILLMWRCISSRLAESLVRGSVTTYLALLSLNILVSLLFNLNL